MSRTRKPPVAQKKVNQLKTLHKSFRDDGIMKTFNQLPPNDDLVFQSIVGTALQDTMNTLDTKLFLGETTHFQTWAVVKVFPKKTQVLFINEYQTGDKAVLKNIEDLALMYPFKVFKAYGDSIYTMHQLRAMILYIFMYTGHGKDLFAMDLDIAKKFLVSGIKRVVDVYKEKGGVRRVPNMHPPSANLTYSLTAVAAPQLHGELVDDDEESTIPADGIDTEDTSDDDESDQDSSDNEDTPDSHEPDKDVVMEENEDGHDIKGSAEYDGDDEGNGVGEDKGTNEDEIVDDNEPVENSEVVDENHITQSPRDDHPQPVKNQTLLAASTFSSSVPGNVSAIRSTMRPSDMQHWHEPPAITGPGSRQKAVFRAVFEHYQAHPEEME